MSSRLDKDMQYNDNFHTSVNLFLDYDNGEKASRFIKTTVNSKVLEYLSNSLSPKSGNHANILVGPYGKGKSHLVLHFLHQHTDFLHIIINGNNKDLDVQFRNALEVALEEHKINIGKHLPEDTVEMYKTLSKKISDASISKYKGIIVVFDEFSKYLESNQTIDTKFLQDFAEMCNRVPNLNLLLITHKAFSNYNNSSELAKVEGRFGEIGLHNNFDASYELIGAAFSLDKKKMEIDDDISEPIVKAFPSIEKTKFKKLFQKLYPLHPLSAFILPRLSELIAQNERTMFTFLSSSQKNSLYDYCGTHEFGEFLTPDYLFDYFEEQLRKSNPSSDVHQIYDQVAKLSETLDDDGLSLKVIKTLGLIYIIGYFEQLPPTYDVLKSIFCSVFTRSWCSKKYGDKKYLEEVRKFESCIKLLRDKECIIYESHNDGYLSLRNLSGINILDQIETKINAISKSFKAIDALNKIVSNEVVYPMRHNDENYLTRYFVVAYSTDLKKNDYKITQNEDVNDKITTADGQIVLKYAGSIDSELLTVTAIDELLKKAVPNTIYYSELEFIREDYFRCVDTYIKNSLAKSNFSEIASDCCDKWFSDSFIYNYELVNRHQITTTTSKARGKVIDILLQSEHKLNKSRCDADLDKYSPEEWSMQEKMIFWTFKKALEDDRHGKKTFHKITNIIRKRDGEVNFGEIYSALQGYSLKIGIRRGIIPLLISQIFSDVLMKQNIVIRKVNVNSGTLISEMPLSGDLFAVIDSAPSSWTYEFTENVALGENLSAYARLFDNFYIGDIKSPTPHLLGEAVNRWYYSLPNLTISAKPEYDDLLSLISKQIISPSEFFTEGIANIEKNIGKDLPAIKSDLDSFINKQYNLVAEHFGVEVNEVDSLVRKMCGLKLKDLDYATLIELLDSSDTSQISRKQTVTNYKLRSFEGRARLLSNEISTALKEMGNAVSQDEKIAILGEMVKGVENGIL